MAQRMAFRVDQLAQARSAVARVSLSASRMAGDDLGADLLDLLGGERRVAEEIGGEVDHRRQILAQAADAHVGVELRPASTAMVAPRPSVRSLSCSAERDAVPRSSIRAANAASPGRPVGSTADPAPTRSRTATDGSSGRAWPSTTMPSGEFAALERRRVGSPRRGARRVGRRCPRSEPEAAIGLAVPARRRHQPDGRSQPMVRRSGVR